MTEDAAVAENNGITVESTTHPVGESPEPKPVEAELEADDSTEVEDQEPEEAEIDDSSKGKKSRWQRSKEKQAALEAEIATLKQQSYKPQDKPLEAKPAPQGPKEADYDNVLDFVVAKAEWAAKQTASTQLEAKEAQRAEQLMVQSYNQKIDAMIEEHPDLPQRLQEIVQSGIVTPAMEKMIISSPVGDQLTLHLTNNVQDLKILRQMYDTQGEIGLATGLGILQGKIINQPKTAVRTSSAPPPITPVNNRSNPKVKTTVEEATSSFEAYQKWRHAK